MINKSTVKGLIFIAGLLASSFVTAKEKLVFAVDLIRHGDRMPIYQIPKSPYFKKDKLGRLTHKGIKQEVALGQKLRKRYVHQYHLLPNKFKPGTIYVRSTDKQRTLLSAQSFLRGLYPEKTRPNQSDFVSIIKLPKWKDRLLLAKPSRNPLAVLNRYYLSKRIWKERTKGMQAKIQLWEEATGFELDSFDELNKLADNLYVRKIHKVELPKGISKQDSDQIIQMTDSAFAEYFKIKSAVEPMGKKFLKRVSGQLDLAANSQQGSHLKYALYSAHDSSIMSVMSTMGAPLGTNPDYGSQLNFALFKDKNDYYVKVSFNDKPVNIPNCKRDRCTLTEFKTLF